MSEYRLYRALVRLFYLSIVGVIWFLIFWLLTSERDIMHWHIIVKFIYVGIMFYSSKVVSEIIFKNKDNE